MPFLVPVSRTKNSTNFKGQIIVTGIFICLSYMLSLLPLALFAIAQTLAIFGLRTAALLSFFVVLFLSLLAILTGLPLFALGALFSILATPIFLIVSLLRKKNTSIFWSATLIAAPLVLFFSAILSTPVLTKDQFHAEIKKIESSVLSSTNRNPTLASSSNANNMAVYDKIKDQFSVIEKDVTLQNFMSWTASERILYFIYGSGFSILFVMLLSFFASLFFLDFAFEQVEKLRAVSNYILSQPRGTFDRLFLDLFKIFQKSNGTKQIEHSTFAVTTHKKIETGIGASKSMLGFFRKNNSVLNTIVMRDYIFTYIGQLPGWRLRTYQIPLILCILSITVYAGMIFYFGDFQNILVALKAVNRPLLAFSIAISAFSTCVLAFLVFQGIFTALKWIPLGLLLFISVVFLIVAPYIAVSVGASYIFLGVFGIIGLLGYLK
jgi:hypothetical protein